MMRAARFAAAVGIAMAMASCGPAQSSRPPGQNSGQNAAQNPSRANMAGFVRDALDPCKPADAQAGAQTSQQTNAGARSTLIQRICAPGALATLDGQIRNALASSSTAITETGAHMLVESQQQWRRAQTIACGMRASDAQPTATQQRCLEDRFRARAQEAASAVQSLGGYLFQRVENLNAAPTPQRFAGSGGGPAITVDVRYPRIDGPQTPQVQAFNQLVAQQPQFRPEQGTNAVTRYTIAYAGPQLISVRFDSSDDTPGAAQTDTNIKTVNVVMTTGQLLTQADVFRTGSGWDDFLTQRAVADLAHQYTDYNFSPPQRDVHETVTKVHLWLITEQGLVLLFPPLSFGGSYDMGSAQVTIPWADLRPYLNPNAPAPIGGPRS